MIQRGKSKKTKKKTLNFLIAQNAISRHIEDLCDRM